MKLPHAGLAFVAFLVLLGALFALMPWLDPGLPSPDPAGVRWTTYANEEIGFSLEIPDSYRPDPGEDGVFFRYEGVALVRVDWLDEESARRQGLWARHRPAAETELGGRPAKRYVYNHFDGPSGVHAHAFVVPHRGRFLALEFRTRKASLLEQLGLGPRRDVEPDGLCERIRASLRLRFPD